MTHHASNNFLFRSASDLIRIGRENDGGYLVSRSDIDHSDVLIGCLLYTSPSPRD